MHTFTKKVTFTPLSRGRYRCNQTGQVLTQKQILAAVSQVLAGSTFAAVGRTDNKQPKRERDGDFTHPSKYRKKSG